jgi:DNA mismatch endonuclease (patch repair protein)
MARIRAIGTGPEQIIASELQSLGLNFEQHVRTLPGRPDFVFPAARLVVFVDGDFWHGWRFPLWKHKLSAKWAAKIEGNRRRDQRNFRRLRRLGWDVLRIWEHSIESGVEACTKRILDRLGMAP